MLDYEDIVALLTRLRPCIDPGSTWIVDDIADYLALLIQIIFTKAIGIATDQKTIAEMLIERAIFVNNIRINIVNKYGSMYSVYRWYDG